MHGTNQTDLMNELKYVNVITPSGGMLLVYNPDWEVL